MRVHTFNRSFRLVGVGRAVTTTKSAAAQALRAVAMRADLSCMLAVVMCRKGGELIIVDGGSDGSEGQAVKP
jgi:hypothetical protein